MDASTLDDRKARARAWFETLRDDICAAFEQLEDEAPPALHPGAAGRFVRKAWERTDHSGAKGGGDPAGAEGKGGWLLHGHSHVAMASGGARVLRGNDHLCLRPSPWCTRGTPASSQNPPPKCTMGNARRIPPASSADGPWCDTKGSTA